MALVSTRCTAQQTLLTATIKWESIAAIQDTAAGSSVVITTTSTTTGGYSPREDTLTLDIYVDNGQTLIRSVVLTPQAASQTTTLYFTDTGLSGGAVVADTFRMRIRGKNTTGLATQTYDINSDNGLYGSPASVPATGNSQTIADQGWVRGTTTVVGTVSNASYGGAKPNPFAFIDQVFLRYLFGAKPAISRTNTITFGPLTLAVASATAAFQNTFGAATIAGTAIDKNWADALTSGQSTALTFANASLTGLPYASLTSTTHDSGNVDPRISMPTVTLGKSLYNRGQASTIAATIKNARNESLTGSIAFQIKDSAAAVKQAASYTGTPYNLAYTIGSSDDATADLVGKQWKVNTNLANVTTNPSANAYKVSSLYQLDTHTQLSTTLVPDTIGVEQNANEQTNFVILGDVMNSWVDVVDASGAAVDTTSGSRVTLTLKNPGGATIQTISTDTKPDATNGNRSGWTPLSSINPGAPAGNWTLEGAVAHNGNTGLDIQAVTFITPLTSNLGTRLIHPVMAKPGQIVRCYFQTETDDTATAPQTVPTYKVTSTAWADVASGSMLNVVDNTATINGAKYYFDLTIPATPGRYNIFTKAQLNGNGIRGNWSFIVGKVAN